MERRFGAPIVVHIYWRKLRSDRVELRIVRRGGTTPFDPSFLIIKELTFYYRDLAESEPSPASFFRSFVPSFLPS